MLQLSGQWHGESLANAYSRWQNSSQRQPPPAVGQFSPLPSGCPLSVIDQAALSFERRWIPVDLSLRVETVVQHLDAV